MLTRITIRHPAVNEIEKVAEFINDIYAEKDHENSHTTYRKPGSAGNRTSELALRQEMGMDYFHIWIALAPDQSLIGTIALKITPDPLREERIRGDINVFSVRKDYRSHKLGLHLQNHLEIEAKKLGVTALFAEVIAEQGKLMEYYKKSGFFITGTLERKKIESFKQSEVSLIHMHKLLPPRL